MGMQAAHRVLMGLEKFFLSFERGLGEREGQVPLLQGRGCGGMELRWERKGRQREEWLCDPRGLESETELWGTASSLLLLSPHPGNWREGIQEVGCSYPSCPTTFACTRTHAHTHTHNQDTPLEDALVCIRTEWVMLLWEEWVRGQGRGDFDEQRVRVSVLPLFCYFSLLCFSLNAWNCRFFSLREVLTWVSWVGTKGTE